MQIASPASLIDALRGSGLLAPAAVEQIAREIAPFGDDTQAALRHVLDNELVPVYQLRKVVHGKTTELFVGPFVVLDKLGEGGMGKVFKARDVRTGRIAALKVIRPHLLANPVVRGRYEREVRAALALRHPNIAAAYEAGDIGGKVYLALEFVDGIDLARLVRTYGVLPVPEACEYLRQAALGLSHAHARGFVHRDIKPGNIVVAGERHHPDATEPAVVKLLDMGLVRNVGLDDDGPSDTDLTRAGTVVGTPDYMAPEQAKNSSLADHRADLYALGGAFYFLLTGKPPFPVGSPIEKILKHQIDPPPPLQAVRPDVPDELARVVSRLMAKRPDDRPDSADEVAELLKPLARFTPGSSGVLHTGPLPMLADKSETGSVASSDTVSPSPSDDGLRLPPRAAPAPVAVKVRKELEEPEPDDTPTPPTPVSIDFEQARYQITDGSIVLRTWGIAAVSALLGVIIGVVAWLMLRH